MASYISWADPKLAPGLANAEVSTTTFACQHQFAAIVIFHIPDVVVLPWSRRVSRYTRWR